MKSRISIALATFNGGKYLLDQLKSFSWQTIQPDELIVVDDCSTDSTVEILKKFKKSAKFEVKIFYNDHNIGYGQNFSRALQLCSGDLVFLSDQDDVWLPNKLEKMTSYFNEFKDIQLFIHDVEYCKEDLSKIGQTKIERMSGSFELNRSYVVGMATAIRGNFLKACLPIPNENSVAHDFWLHSCASAIGKKFVVRDVLALYRRHSSNTTKIDGLNVDFVTTPRYFNFRLFKNKTVLPEAQITLFSRWLKNNRTLLVEHGYTTAEQIDAVIEGEMRRMECTSARAKLLAKRRVKRLFPVFSLLRRGGYQYFRGWKSAVKDMFLN